MLSLNLRLIAGISVSAVFLSAAVFSLERRSDTVFERAPSDNEFYNRHNDAYAVSAACALVSLEVTDALLLGKATDRSMERDGLLHIYHPPGVRPAVESFSPNTARAAWGLVRTTGLGLLFMDRTRDVLAASAIPWSMKKRWTDRALRFYLDETGLALSPAPLEMTLRRAGIVTKPYFTIFRNLYPRTATLLYACIWRDEAGYQAILVSGNGSPQDAMVRRTDAVFFNKALEARPRQMLLGREVMPAYSRLSPESANIFDNFNMLQELSRDVMAYDRWTIDEKKKELYRVIRALSLQDGDEELSRRFAVRTAELDPRDYARDYEEPGKKTWALEGIMEDMTVELLGMLNAPGDRRKALEQMRMKLRPGIEADEGPGSFMDAIGAAIPGLSVALQGRGPGETPATADAMTKAWLVRTKNMTEAPPLRMDTEPPPPGGLRERPRRSNGAAHD